MKNEFENSDKRLQEKLEGFRMAAPEGAWAGIEGNIGGKAGGRGRFFYLWMALIIIGVTGAGIFTFLYMNNNEEVNAAKTSSVATNEISDNNQNDPNNNKQNNTSSKESQSSQKTHENSTGNSNGSVNTENSHNSASTSGQSASTNSTSSSTQQQTRSNSSNSNASNNTTSSQNASSTSSQSNTTVSNSSTNTSNNSSSNNTANNTASNSTTSSNSNQSTNNTASNNTSSATSNNSTSETSNATSAENSSPSNTEENNTVVENNTSENNASSENETAQNEVVKDTTGIVGLPNGTRPDPISIDPLDPKLPPATKVRPSWSLEAGVDLSSVNFNHTAANNAGLQQSLNASYSQNFAQAAFLRVNYKPFQRFSFHSGLEYAQNKATQDYSWLTTTSTFQYDTTGWYFDSITQQQLPIVDTIENISSVENQTQFKSTVSQVYIPLGVMFHVPLGTRSELGINATGLVGIRSGSTGEILVDENGNSIAVTEAYRSVNFSARTALRYTYFINGKSAVYAEPYVGFGLNDRSNTTLPFGTRFRNSGIRVGFRYNF